MWYTATSASVSVTTNPTIVSITTGDDISIIQEDSGLIFEGESPVQVKRGYIDGSGNKFIELQSPWPYSTKTNQPLVAYPTDASFAEATAELRRVIDEFEIASTIEAQEGTDDTKAMSALKTKQAIDFNKVSSNTDTTAGRLLTVGYGGLGGVRVAKGLFSNDLLNLTTTTDYNGMVLEVAVDTSSKPSIAPSNVAGNVFVNGETLIFTAGFPSTEAGNTYVGLSNGTTLDWRKIYDSGNTNFNEFVFNQNETKDGIARNGSEVVIELPINSKVDPTSISATGTFYVVNSITSVTEATGAAPTIIGASSQRNLIVVLSSSGSFTKGDPYTVVAEAGGVTIEANY